MERGGKRRWSAANILAGGFSPLASSHLVHRQRSSRTTGSRTRTRTRTRTEAELGLGLALLLHPALVFGRTKILSPDPDPDPDPDHDLDLKPACYQPATSGVQSLSAFAFAKVPVPLLAVVNLPE